MLCLSLATNSQLVMGLNSFTRPFQLINVLLTGHLNPELNYFIVALAESLWLLWFLMESETLKEFFSRSNMTNFSQKVPLLSHQSTCFPHRLGDHQDVFGKCETE